LDQVIAVPLFQGTDWVDKIRQYLASFIAPVASGFGWDFFFGQSPAVAQPVQAEFAKRFNTADCEVDHRVPRLALLRPNDAREGPLEVCESILRRACRH
jgi:hypothetical protein